MNKYFIPFLVVVSFLVVLAVLTPAQPRLAAGAAATSSQNLFQSLFQILTEPFLRASSTLPIVTPAPSLYKPVADYEQQVIDTVGRASPAVVSIIISKKVPIIEQYYTNPFDQQDLPPEFRNLFNFQVPQERVKGYQEQQVGGGSGFFVTSDGLVVTNKHVVEDQTATYTVFLSDGRKFEGRVLAIHPTDDLALIKISATGLPYLALGDSDSIKPGQTAIAIGNALGEFTNTVSVGVVSGLRRSIAAQLPSSGTTENLENLIQTDAAINPGNSGGPLLNLRGEVIGVNTAIVTSAQSIGFAIPSNRVRRMTDSVQKTGKILVPYIGVRYVLVTDSLARTKRLSVNYGALLTGDGQNPAVVAGSPADTAGLKDGDIILQYNGAKITPQTSLASMIAEGAPGQVATLTVLRGAQTLTLSITLGTHP